MLLQIREYLNKVKIASNQQIARQFGMDVLALQPLLDLWHAKGEIRPFNQERKNCKNPCGSSCGGKLLTYYQACRSSPF